VVLGAENQHGSPQEDDHDRQVKGNRRRGLLSPRQVEKSEAQFTDAVYPYEGKEGQWEQSFGEREYSEQRIGIGERRWRK